VPAWYTKDRLHFEEIVNEVADRENLLYQALQRSYERATKRLKADTDNFYQQRNRRGQKAYRDFELATKDLRWYRSKDVPKLEKAQKIMWDTQACSERVLDKKLQPFQKIYGAARNRAYTCYIKKLSAITGYVPATT
jgi:hypothetical protein